MIPSFIGNCIATMRDAILFPPFCAYCKVFQKQPLIVCANCLALIKPIVSTDIIISSAYAMKVLAISDYQEPLKSLIIAKSWSDSIASQQLGHLIWTMTYFKYLPCDILVPVPLHWTRYAKRGFNQAEIMAQVLAEKKGCSVENLVKRVKRTPFQSTLAVIDRSQNVADAFVLKDPSRSLAGKHIVIVDDLMTTGATLKAIAKELARAKPASLSAVLACRLV